MEAVRTTSGIFFFKVEAAAETKHDMGAGAETKHTMEAVDTSGGVFNAMRWMMDVQKGLVLEPF